MVAGLTITGRHRFLLQASNEGAGGGVSLEEVGDRIGCWLAGDRVRELRSQEREKLLRCPHRKPFDRVGQDVGILTLR
jgi:hypothetical protein